MDEAATDIDLAHTAHEGVEELAMAIDGILEAAQHEVFFGQFEGGDLLFIVLTAQLGFFAPQHVVAIAFGLHDILEGGTKLFKQENAFRDGGLEHRVVRAVGLGKQGIRFKRVGQSLAGFGERGIGFDNGQCKERATGGAGGDVVGCHGFLHDTDLGFEFDTLQLHLGQFPVEGIESLNRGPATAGR